MPKGVPISYTPPAPKRTQANSEKTGQQSFFALPDALQASIKRQEAANSAAWWGLFE
jgi:hypothetical protein